jgi:hypothetical protein
MPSVPVLSPEKKSGGRKPQSKKMGTASTKVIHQSGGAFGSDAWFAAYECYLKKYGS